MASDRHSGWDLDSLNKAYKQGHIAGSMHMDRARCPYRGDIVIAAWEAGWEDGAAEAVQDASQSRSA